MSGYTVPKIKPYLHACKLRVLPHPSQLFKRRHQIATGQVITGTAQGMWLQVGCEFGPFTFLFLLVLCRACRCRWSYGGYCRMTPGGQPHRDPTTPPHSTLTGKHATPKHSHTLTHSTIEQHIAAEIGVTDWKRSRLNRYSCSMFSQESVFAQVPALFPQSCFL